MFNEEKNIYESFNLIKSYIGNFFSRTDSSQEANYRDILLRKTGDPDYMRQLAMGYFATIETRVDLMKIVDNYRDFYLVQGINDVIIDDGFNQIGGDLCHVTYNSPELDKVLEKTVQKEIDKFMESFEVQNIIEDILEDFITYSEYFLRVKGEKGKGIVDIIDDVDLDRHLGIYQLRKPKYFVEFDGEKLNQIDKEEFVHFIYSPRKLRIRTEDYRTLNRLPSFIRTGRPYIYGIHQKLKELQVLETSSIASDLKRILAPILIMLGIPANTPPKNALQATKLYEEKLNSLFKDVNTIQNYSMNEILALANKFTVLPNFGDGKGSIETLELKREDDNTAEKINQIKSDIGNTEGIPLFYLGVAGESGLPKMDTLKIYSRYTRKLVKYQNSVASGVRDLNYRHLRLKGLIVKKENIAVGFKSIPNVDLLDDIEHMVGLSTSIQNIFATFSDISSSDQVSVKTDSEKLVAFLDNYLGVYPSLKGIMKLEEFEKGTEPGEGDEFGMSPEYDEPEGIEPMGGSEPLGLELETPEPPEELPSDTEIPGPEATM